MSRRVTVVSVKLIGCWRSLTPLPLELHSEDELSPRPGPSYHAKDLTVMEPVYDLQEIKLSDILVLTDRTIKVWIPIFILSSG